jgi:FkbH-like protein
LEDQALLTALWQKHPGPTLAGFVTTRFEQLGEALAPVRTKVALLRSCTLEPIIPVLRAAAWVNNIDLHMHIGDFNTYAQEIFDPQSGLYQFAPDIALLFVHTQDIAPDLYNDFADLEATDVTQIVERVIGDFRSWISTFRTRSQAHLVVHNLELPVATANGVLDSQARSSQAEAIRTINLALRQLATEHTGVYILDYDGLVARHGREGWHDQRKWLTMRVPLRSERMITFAQEWLRFIHPLTGRVCKALVVDLDNTLWGGVIGEDGIENIKVGQDYPGAAYLALQRAILDLHRRGILLAICSKNNPADAMEALEKHEGMLLRPKHFAALKMNWEDKASNLRAIAAELNIGIDALAFLDDNPAERQLIRSHVPEVTVIDLPSDPMAYAQTLPQCPVFERLTLSAEDRERGRYYAEERQRAELQLQTGSLEDFYRSLQIEVDVGLVTPDTVARTAQLTQKTNQFNLTTRRYNEQQIASLAADPEWRVYTVHARDRFGDNGLIGVAIIHLQKQACDLDTFLLSCRVIGRTVETAVLAEIGVQARALGALCLTGKFIATKKNAPAREFYPSHGFTCIRESESSSDWELDLLQTIIATPSWIKCRFIAPH